MNFLPIGSDAHVRYCTSILQVTTGSTELTHMSAMLPDPCGELLRGLHALAPESITNDSIQEVLSGEYASLTYNWRTLGLIL